MGEQTISNETLPAMEGADGWFALAPPTDPDGLGASLAHLRASGQAVRGFVDRATLLAAWLGSFTADRARAGARAPVDQCCLA